MRTDRTAALLLALVAVAGCAASDSTRESDPTGTYRDEPRKSGPFPSAIITSDQAVVEHLPVGELRRYLDGATTACLRDVVTGFAILNPGQQVHPPHQHAEEEFLYIVSGEGTWSLDGKESPAHPGDLMYSEPWVMHGLLNSGSEPLTFFVVKWNPADRDAPKLPPKR